MAGGGSAVPTRIPNRRPLSGGFQIAEPNFSEPATPRRAWYIHLSPLRCAWPTADLATLGTLLAHHQDDCGEWVTALCPYGEDGCPDNEGDYDIVMPEPMMGTSGSGYKVRVMDVDDEEMVDCSDDFYLMASEEAPDVGDADGPYLHVTAPEEGDVAHAGDEYTVEVRREGENKRRSSAQLGRFVAWNRTFMVLLSHRARLGVEYGRGTLVGLICSTARQTGQMTWQARTPSIRRRPWVREHA